MLLLCQVSRVFRPSLLYITWQDPLLYTITYVYCSLLSECNSETSQNGTYFTNPMTLTSVCSLMIRPMNDQICQVGGEDIRREAGGAGNKRRTVGQVRLDLEMFNLVDPDVTGNCRTDYMQVILNYEHHFLFSLFSVK